MKRRSIGLGLVSLLLGCTALAGCGGGENGGGNAGTTSQAGESASSLDIVMSPPAIEDGPVDEEAAAQGEALFKEKGCSACHAFGTRVTGPDLAGVTKRRSRDWIEHMIQDPVTMVKEDPDAKQLLATYLVMMPDLNIDDSQAHQLVEFFKAQETP